MQSLYTVALYLLLPLVLLRMAWRGFHNRDHIRRWPERFGCATAIPAGAPVICLHAVSVGEVVAAQPLLRLLTEKFPQYRVVITTVTPTGAATVQQKLGEDVTHVYFPYDLPWAVNRFLRRVRPRLMIIMETELWPNLFSACRRHGVPVALVNARMSLRSLRRYALLPGLSRKTVQAASVISAQSKVDAARFVE
ncbi:MAG: 3-deoxy-D-manno-octulosonic acid transferase, partial [Gammaproteobacteria bacterium]|nr:3-deoxy-D-manno-octulosonic acid transferase [Gammaproteobacteria bacterium]